MLFLNIAKIMIPKISTVFLHEQQTVRQGWEVMTRGGYTAIPVLDDEERYIGSVTEGDFLRYVFSVESLDKLDMEKHRVGELVRREFCPSVSIDASEDEVISATLNQNFVPIVDSRNTMCGIITRQGIIAYLAEKRTH